MLSNKTYDILKWAAQVAIPAIATFYGVVGTTFNIPYTKETLIIASAFDALLGSLLGLSSSSYNKAIGGEIVVDNDNEIDDGK